MPIDEKGNYTPSKYILEKPNNTPQQQLTNEITILKQRKKKIEKELQTIKLQLQEKINELYDLQHQKLNITQIKVK